MHISYTLLSPTWGMHQYTADLAARAAAAGHRVSLVTTRHAPLDRYPPHVEIHTPIATRDSGFSLDGLRHTLRALRHSPFTTHNAPFTTPPDLVHVTGPHLANPLLLRALHRARVPTVHTIHDLHPHAGAAYGRLLYGWNRWVEREAGHILVHGQCWAHELIDRKGETSVTSTPLTHLFVAHEQEQGLRAALPDVTYEPWALFIGRLEPYKGLDVLLEAVRQVDLPSTTAVVAGPGAFDKGLRKSSRTSEVFAPPGVDFRNRLIADDEAIDLFRRCAVVVLPYVEASQSALIAAAYFFQKPVIATTAGALAEYVVDGETGWLIPPDDPVALAGALAEALSAARADPARLVRMGRAARTWYDRTRAAETATLLDMYERIANG